MNSRRCTAVTHSGDPCKAWAVRDTDPPLCSVQAGRNVGVLLDNQNACKRCRQQFAAFSVS